MYFSWTWLFLGNLKKVKAWITVRRQCRDLRSSHLALNYIDCDQTIGLTWIKDIFHHKQNWWHWIWWPLNSIGLLSFFIHIYWIYSFVPLSTYMSIVWIFKMVCKIFTRYEKTYWFQQGDHTEQVIKGCHISSLYRNSNSIRTLV